MNHGISTALFLRSGIALLASLATGDAALAQCGTAAAGSCLLPHTTPFCDDENCCETVCSADPSCCDTQWDAQCVMQANQICVGLCGADVNGSCLKAHITPSCDDEACCELICGFDSFCCEVRWDFACAIAASLNCDLGSGGNCGDPQAGSCFEAHPNGACEDRACCTAVCAVNPSCCDVSWDFLCVRIAGEVCFGSCQPVCPAGSILEGEGCQQNTNDPCYFPSPSPVLKTIPANGVGCGHIKVGPSPNGFVQDVDVWNVVAPDGNGDGVVSVQLTFSSGFQGFAALIPATGCPPLSAALAHVNSAKCVESSGETVCVPAGAYRVVVASGTWPNFGMTTVECGDADRYFVRILTSEIGCAKPCSSASGPCFEVHKGPGCNDPECCEATCAVDPVCCEFGWDGECAKLAISLCAEAPDNDHCGLAAPITLGATAFSSIGATNSLPGAPAMCIESGPGPAVRDVWFLYSPPNSGTATATTCGSQIPFNSAIAIYTGTCNALTLVACDDDASGVCFPADAARVSWAARCGVSYLVRVGGGWGDGTLTLTSSSGEACASCPADLDGSGAVNATDLAILLGAWGTAGGASDLDGSGSVGAPDLAILLGAWGPCN
ncbi:MAG: hypothetical protein SGJ11_12485 [Phycisphaerae bacterium]|nr:hypothetical protein [Phycisphaerae bacterium]